MSIVRRAIELAQERRGADPRAPWGDSTPPPPSLVGAGASGIPVTQAGAAGISAVFGCCSLIADSVAALPIELRNGSDRRTAKLLPLSPLLTKPYAEISCRDWWISFIWALALRGNFYGLVIERDDLSLPVQVKPIHNDAVQIWRDRSSGRLIYRFYGQEVPIDDVVHVRYQTLPGEIVGLNPIQLLALSFGNALAKERFVESFYMNSANPMGVLEVPGYLDRTETRKMMRSWISAHQGLNKANLPAILTEGTTFRPVTISPGDAQLIEALQFSDIQICGRIFRVPPHMIGILERVSGLRGIEQLERSFFAHTLLGYLQIACETMTSLHRPNQYVHFDTTQRTRGSYLERAQAGALGMNSGFFVADDVRETFDLAELPNGDGQISYMPVNTQMLKMAEATLKQFLAAPTQPQTVSGSQPRPGIPPAKSALPPRKGSPNGSAQVTGREMSPDEAVAVIEAALDQQRRTEYAANLATRLNGHGHDDPEDD